MPVSVVPNLPYFSDVAPASVAVLAVWGCACSYVMDEGTRAVPVAGPRGTPCKIVRRHGGMARKVIRWLAVGWGGKPPLPSTDTQCANEILHTWDIGKPAEGKSVDGQDLIGVFGRYTYWLLVAPTPQDTLSFTTAPWASSPSVSVYSLSPSDFTKYFVGPSQAPAGGQFLRN